ncbi:MAG: hypothetical protein VX000_16535, partial [Myxococcota bacterium]|nr:hypothetical protein [Myxococcota bacterium]
MATAVVLTPTSVYTDDTLTAAPTGEDPDEDTLSWTYLWYVDGTEVVGVTGDTLDGALYFDRGQSVYVIATPTDGSARGTSVASAATTILNTVPTAPAVSLTPDPATTTDTLRVSASGSTDPDGTDTVTYSYAWYEDADPSSISVGTTLPSSSTRKGSTYRVVVTPSDGTGLGPSTDAEVTIDNTAPVLSGPTLSAATVQVGDTLTCTAGATDVDPVDAPTVTYAWSDGSTGATYTVTSSDAPGGSITCTATADDGDGGTDSASVSATVANTDPVLSGVGVTPSTGRVGDVLTCSATATDADAGTPTITYSWTGGATGATYTILDTDDPGDVLTCTATAADTDGGTASDTASAVVENTAPVMDTVSISPASANNDDTLTCAAAASDADGGVPAITYAWSGSIGGSLGTGATIDLSATTVESGETVTCTATADDGDGGTDVGTAALTTTNRAPAVSHRRTPASGAVTSDTLTCTASASDDDGDSLSTSFAWTVGGSVVPASSTASLSSTLAGAFVAGDEVECTATTTDGKGGSDTDAVSTTIINTAPTVGTPSLSPAT